MRRLIAATCSAGVAIAMASPAAGAPPPTVPSDAAIGQYIEVVPSATGLVPTGVVPSPAKGAALPTALQAEVERTAGADAPALLRIAQDPRFGAPRPRTVRAPRTVARPRGNPGSAIPRQPVLESAGAPTPSPLAAAASTAGSGRLLLVALLLVAITAAGIAARAARR
jgi:hypothetical protein